MSRLKPRPTKPIYEIAGSEKYRALYKNHEECGSHREEMWPSEPYVADGPPKELGVKSAFPTLDRGERGKV